MMYGAQQQYERAILEFQGALRINPQSAMAHFNLAATYEKTGERDKAIEHWQKYIGIAKAIPSEKQWVEEARKHLQTLQKF